MDGTLPLPQEAYRDETGRPLTRFHLDRNADRAGDPGADAAEAILERVGLDLPLASRGVSGCLGDGSAWSLAIVSYREDGLPEVAGQPGLLSAMVRVTHAVDCPSNSPPCAPPG
ncbi:hypothetical protein E9232_003385 [Inquilinus ginsengisoli]|uniref:Uncharacterized protein n=1 Tax=Inquilinus ginsengisoli TaxID=363840 RepID=A0ABU1JQG1_9PROT|nr:hypothetical protein [Inquilinus ginsengisoli]MDR6290859.1 hypothetical protein [Inquilinus ginsengisoli]